MVKPIVRDIFFLGQKSAEATKQDLSVGLDLQDTLRANQNHCDGMAVNMIGVKKCVIIVSLGFASEDIYNPLIVRKDTPYVIEMPKKNIGVPSMEQRNVYCEDNSYEPYDIRIILNNERYIERYRCGKIVYINLAIAV